ncbi:hypothetical protein E2986_13142 [Frieseomelitta varia]|uniref:Uncharacterized protein n=1 Tax=Frieseomelitta varia TaxID=561572 RepID=A0A833S9P9_9HYME|nr:hypothetical protein E2986_13142 [Frieseomelitta varia]
MYTLYKHKEPVFALTLINNDLLDNEVYPNNPNVKTQSTREISRSIEGEFFIFLLLGLTFPLVWRNRKLKIGEEVVLVWLLRFFFFIWIDWWRHVVYADNLSSADDCEQWSFGTEKDWWLLCRLSMFVSVVVGIFFTGSLKD